MQLSMRKKHQSAQTLDFRDDTIETGAMGDCVSAIVMWDPIDYSGRTYFRQMRGFHGDGGIREVNWSSLFEGVEDLPTTQLYLLLGPNNGEDDGTFETAMFEVRREAPRQASFMIAFGIASVTIDRYGELTKCEGKNPRGMDVVAGRHQFPELTGRRRSVGPAARKISKLKPIDDVAAFSRDPETIRKLQAMAYKRV